MSGITLKRLECPRCDAIGAQYAQLLQDSNDSIRCLMWRDPKVLANYMIAVLDESET